MDKLKGVAGIQHSSLLTPTPLNASSLQAVSKQRSSTTPAQDHTKDALTTVFSTPERDKRPPLTGSYQTSPQFQPLHSSRLLDPLQAQLQPQSQPQSQFQPQFQSQSQSRSQPQSQSSFQVLPQSQRRGNSGFYATTASSRAKEEGTENVLDTARKNNSLAKGTLVGTSINSTGSHFPTSARHSPGMSSRGAIATPVLRSRAKKLGGDRPNVYTSSSQPLVFTHSEVKETIITDSNHGASVSLSLSARARSQIKTPKEKLLVATAMRSTDKHASITQTSGFESSRPSSRLLTSRHQDQTKLDSTLLHRSCTDTTKQKASLLISGETLSVIPTTSIPNSTASNATSVREHMQQKQTIAQDTDRKGKLPQGFTSPSVSSPRLLVTQRTIQTQTRPPSQPQSPPQSLQSLASIAIPLYPLSSRGKGRESSYNQEAIFSTSRKVDSSGTVPISGRPLYPCSGRGNAPIDSKTNVPQHHISIAPTSTSTRQHSSWTPPTSARQNPISSRMSSATGRTNVTTSRPIVAPPTSARRLPTSARYPMSSRGGCVSSPLLNDKDTLEPSSAVVSTLPLSSRLLQPTASSLPKQANSICGTLVSDLPSEPIQPKTSFYHKKLAESASWQSRAHILLASMDIGENDEKSGRHISSIPTVPKSSRKGNEEKQLAEEKKGEIISSDTTVISSSFGGEMDSIASMINTNSDFLNRSTLFQPTLASARRNSAIAKQVASSGVKK